MYKRTLFIGAALLALPLAAVPLLLRAQDVPIPVSPIAPVTPTAPVEPTAQAVPLRYKWTRGQVRRYKMTMTMNSTIPNGRTGESIPMNMVMQTVMRQTVKSVSPTDGAATIVTQMEQTRTAMNGRQTSLPAAQQAQMKKPITMQMLPTGKVLSLQMPGTSTASVPGMDIGKSLMGSTLAFPDRLVKVGDTWSGALGAGMMGMQMTMASTLAGLETRNGAQIATVSQKISGDLSGMANKAMPASVSLSGKISGTGTLVFDTTAGALVSQSLQDAIDVTVTAQPGAPAGMPPSVDIHMQQTTLMERLPGAAPRQ